MWEALREGLDEEMERDPTVCMMGAPPAVTPPALPAPAFAAVATQLAVRAPFM